MNGKHSLRHRNGLRRSTPERTPSRHFATAAAKHLLTLLFSAAAFSASLCARPTGRPVPQPDACTPPEAELFGPAADPAVAAELIPECRLHRIEIGRPPAAAPAVYPAAEVAPDPSCRLRPQQLIAPAALVTIGALCIGDGPLHRINESVQERMLDWSGRNRFRADDYLQYLPVAAGLGLGTAGANARHSFKERAVVTATSYLAMGIMVNCVKWTVGERRPDSGSMNSFPSGHTATAFMGAELVRSEYGLGYGLAAYAVAGGVAFLRLYNNRHWLGDVLAGAGIGILSARIGYWLLPIGRRLFRLDGRRITVASAPTFDPRTRAAGVALSIVM